MKKFNRREALKTVIPGALAFSMPTIIPRMFTDALVRSNLLTTIKALTKLAEEKN